ncbi:MAG: ECF transporter S component [Cellulosilyticaceae bacterium]
MKNYQQTTRRFTTKDLVIIGLLAAICTVATYIKIPVGTGAFVHLGSAAIFASAILFGGVKGGLAGAIGSGFFDLLGGFSPYTLWSFVIKGVAGLIIGSVATNKSIKKAVNGRVCLGLALNVFATLLGAIWTLAGYLVAWTVVIGSWEAAVGNIMASVMSSAVGMAVGIPLAMALRKPLARYINEG